MNKGLLLSDEAIQAAFDGDFGEVYFGHKPTPDDILLVKLRLVAKAQLAKVLKHIPDEEEIKKDYEALILEHRREYEAKVKVAKEIAKKQERERIAKIAYKYLDAGICDICYEDNCGDEFTCTKGRHGEPCKCHSRINDSRANLEKALRKGE